MVAADPSFHMWFTLALVGAAIIAYAQDRIPMELTSLGLLAVLAGVFHFFPLTDATGANRLGLERMFSGFANPALIAVVSLLVVGQGLVRTGALDSISQVLFRLGRIGPIAAISASLAAALAISAVLNNTPVVVMLIPIMVALSDRLDRAAGKVLIPLSYAAILGGMTTLIGSSTNLLVSGAATPLGHGPLNFFDFTVPGLVLAGIGIIYVLLVAPALLGEHAPEEEGEPEAGGKQFIAQLEVDADSPLVGKEPVAGMFPGLPDMTVLMVQRGAQSFRPPLEDLVLAPGDIIMVAATRRALTDVLGRARSVQPRTPGTSEAAWDEEPKGAREQVMAEVVVAPASLLTSQRLEQINFRRALRCTLLGIQRRSRMIRTRLNEIRLEAGDVLLIRGHRRDVQRLRANRDVLLLEWSATELPSYHHAWRATLIFFSIVALIATGAVPTALAAFAGAVLIIAGGCLNIRQAIRAIDRKVVMIVASAIALGTALYATGGAAYLADGLVSLLAEAHPAVVLSAFFLLAAVFTNVLSNNACAVLFTPIAVQVAQDLAVDPFIFVIAVVLASNCSFATPIGYQTNLLVMTPGRYRFSDFLRAGTPLIILLWIGFSLFAPWYYGLL